MAFGAPSVKRNNTPKIKLANNVYKMFTWKEVIWLYKSTRKVLYFPFSNKVCTTYHYDLHITLLFCIVLKQYYFRSLWAWFYREKKKQLLSLLVLPILHLVIPISQFGCIEVSKNYNHNFLILLFNPCDHPPLIFAFIQIKFKSTDTPESRTDSSILIFQDLQFTSVTHTSILTCWVLLKYILIMFLLFRIYLTSGVFVVL